jgi:hypothetical protein
MPKATITTEQYLQRIRDFHKKNNRVPHSEECGEYTNKVLVKRLGSWDAAVRAALGIRSGYAMLTRDDITAEISARYKELGRIPFTKDFTTAFEKQAKKFFPNVLCACEAALKTSLRVEVLRALRQLTPPGCDYATTQEIAAHLTRCELTVNNYEAMSILDLCRRDALIAGTRGDRLMLWQLTTAGKKFLENFKE